MSFDYEPVPRSIAYHECLLCYAVMPLPTARTMRRHYQVFHLISKESAIAELLVTAEKLAAVEAEAIQQFTKKSEVHHEQG